MPYKMACVPLATRVEDLLARMTIEEKADQLIQIPIGQDTNPNNIGEAEFRPTVGSLLNSRHGARVHNTFQRAAVAETRLGIPILFAQDVIHGCVTIYPHALGQACSFRPALAERCAREAAREAVAMGYRWTFSPMIDVARDPRWGRVAEGYGEDAFVNGAFAAATVRGYQSADLSAPDSIAACLKHYVGYGWSEGGRDYAYTDVSARTLWESCLPPYQAGVAAGAATVMSAFNDIGGVPAVANHYTLTEVLRTRWGFDGFVVSDWGSVGQLALQGRTSDPALQTKICLEAGNDMDMGDQVYRNIPALIAAGKLDMATVDEAVRRVLRVKFRLGLFENPYFQEVPFEQAFLQPATLAAAEALAAETLVLLKNSGDLLPLAAGRRVALIGPLADAPASLIGSWSCCGRTEDVITIRAALQARCGDRLTFAHGCPLALECSDESGFAQAIQAANASDLIVLCLGESDEWSGENHSRAVIELPPIQEKLLEALQSTGKPVLLVLVHGRPLGLQRVEPRADAILAAWQPGTQGGNAIADVLFGGKNPSGRLAVTFPRHTGQIPMYYCDHPRARIWPGMNGKYIDLEDTPLYEFGHGLSYTTFEYRALRLNRATISAVEVMTATVTVCNTGARAGAETIFWYLRDPEASFTQPRRRLIAFEKIDLAPGENREVALLVEPLAHLSYPDADGRRILEPGSFVLEASRRVEAEFTLLEATRT
jgi:beta-glucosidase